MNARQFTAALEGALEVATDEDAFPVERIRSQRTILVLRADVTGLPQREIDALATEMIVQGEASDDYTEGVEGHRNVYVAASLEVEEGPFVLIDGNEFRLTAENVSIA